MKLKTFSGRVVRVAWAKGSKSAHAAVCLEVANGQRLRLRLEGGNPFYDERLEALVGKSIQAKGELLDGSTLEIRDWSEC